MIRLALASWLLVAAAWSLAADPPAAADPPRGNTIPLNGHVFTLPAGFTIELVAAPPLIDRPIVADFDEQGRLYVAEANGGVTKEDVAKQKPMHRVLRLEDTDGDGRFDRRTIFADQVLFPEGCMWYDGSLYVAAPPSIWKLTDTNGDGVADERVEWFQGKTLTGCANDLHGPYRGPDGWIYWAKGAFAPQTYERPGKAPFQTRASHLFRCRPDGSGIEPVMTGGMDNPVDVVFTPGGERIFTTTFFQHPGGGRRDGLIHAIYGGIYGKDHDVLYDRDHRWTSPALMPVLTHMGPAAPCGLTCYESPSFGREYPGNLFACQFNLHKVSRHVLVPEGASFTTKDEDFVVSSNLDFHPTDVIEDADGSLLVVDTGGWYKLCCPTSQLHKPDILGGIYRVRRQDAPRVADPRGARIPWAAQTPAALAALLGDERPAVRWRAVELLGRRQAEAVPVLAQIVGSSTSAQARRHAVWAATRIDDAAARAIARQALQDADETVRQVALHAISVRRDREAVSALLPLLRSASPANRRAAAEALGRIGDRSAVPALLEAVGQPADRALEHSLTYALIEIADPKATAAGLAGGNVLTLRAALVALDQMDSGTLSAATVAPALSAADARLKEAAWWIASRHPEWSGELAGVLRARLAAQSLTAAEQDELAAQLARFARATAAQQLLADLLQDPTASREARRIILRAMAQASLREAPERWTAALTDVLAGAGELTPDALAAVRAQRYPKQRPDKLVAALLRLAQDAPAPAAVRLAALAAVPGGPGKLEPATFAFVRAQLAPDQSVGVRTAAADVLSRARLSTEQLLALTEAVKTAGPAEVDRLLDPFAQSADEKVGQALVAALQATPARSGLIVASLRPRLAKFSPSVQKQAEELYAALDADAAKQRVRLEEMLATLQGGDIRRGQAVFHSAKAACAACHAIGYLGGNVGPDLTRIGNIRTERDLLEAIAFPSASFVRSYEPVVVVTKDGRLHNGVIRKDAADELVLATGVNQEVRLPRSEVEEIQPSKVSVMPGGLDQQLTPQELADLVAFLKACK